MEIPLKGGMPGEDWFHNFCHRERLSLKNLEPLDKLCRVATGDPLIVYGFYYVLEEQIAVLGLAEKPQNIYNLVETSFCSDPLRVKGLSGVRQKVHRYTAGTGRDNTNREVLPPLIVFQAARLWSTWKGTSDLPGTFYAATENGWMTSAVFLEWRDRRLFVIFDRAPYTFRYGDCEVCNVPERDNRKIATSHDRFIATFGTLLSWTRSNQRKLQKHEFVHLLCHVWHEGLTADNIHSGLRSTGIYPPNLSKYPVTRFDSVKYESYLSRRPRCDDVPAPSEVNPDRVEMQNGDEQQPGKSIDDNTERPQYSLFLTYPSTSGHRPLPSGLLHFKLCYWKILAAVKHLHRKDKELILQPKKHEHSNEDISGEEEVIQENNSAAIDEDSENKSNMETVPQEEAEILEPINIKRRDFLLAMFKGGRRGCIIYKYVVTIDSAFEDDEYRVTGLKSDGDKKTFKLVENDVSVFKMYDILGILPVPSMCHRGQ
ncbi:hypothetical protein PR048_026357, partial [Dryococelus australis]